MLFTKFSRISVFIATVTCVWASVDIPGSTDGHLDTGVAEHARAPVSLLNEIALGPKLVSACRILFGRTGESSSLDMIAIPKGVRDGHYEVLCKYSQSFPDRHMRESGYLEPADSISTEKTIHIPLTADGSDLDFNIPLNQEGRPGTLIRAMLLDLYPSRHIGLQSACKKSFVGKDDGFRLVNIKAFRLGFEENELNVLCLFTESNDTGDRRTQLIIGIPLNADGSDLDFTRFE
jgi:hypothetical protein